MTPDLTYRLLCAFVTWLRFSIPKFALNPQPSTYILSDFWSAFRPLDFHLQVWHSHILFITHTTHDNDISGNINWKIWLLLDRHLVSLHQSWHCICCHRDKKISNFLHMTPTNISCNIGMQLCNNNHLPLTGIWKCHNQHKAMCRFDSCESILKEQTRST